MHQFDAFKTLKNPAHRPTGSWLVDLIGNGLLSVGQLGANPVFSQAIHQQTQNHDEARNFVFLSITLRNVGKNY
jgi:hypothetical protein